MKSRKKLTRYTAYGGVCAALCIALMSLSAILPTADLTFAAAAGFILFVIVIKCGKAVALSVYVVTGLLALLVVPNKACVLYYVLFFGYYSILKAVAEGLHNRVLEWAVKLAVFTAIVLVIFYGFTWVLELPAVIQNNVFLVVLCADALFVIYDILFSALVQMIMKRFKL